MKKLLLIPIISLLLFGCSFKNQGNVIKNTDVRPRQASQQSTPNTESSKKVVELETPKPNEVLKSPFIIKGEADFAWFPEGWFEIFLVDKNKNQISSIAANSTKYPLTGKRSPFISVSEMKYKYNETKDGYLILRKHESSSLNSDDIEVPITFNNNYIWDKKLIIDFNQNSESAKKFIKDSNSQGTAIWDRSEGVFKLDTVSKDGNIVKDVVIYSEIEIPNEVNVMKFDFKFPEIVKNFCVVEAFINSDLIFSYQPMNPPKDMIHYLNGDKGWRNSYWLEGMEKYAGKKVGLSFRLTHYDWNNENIRQAKLSTMVYIDNIIFASAK